MCKLKSGIITYKNKTAICDLDTDSHEDLIFIAGLKDDNLTPNFAKVELLPKDGDIFNHKINNWELKVDQDVIPDWFDKKKARRLMIKPLKETFKKRFIVNKLKVKVETGRYFVKNSKVGAYGDSRVVAYDSKVGAFEYSKVEAWGHSKVRAYGNSRVEAFGGVEVCSYENSTVRRYIKFKRG